MTWKNHSKLRKRKDANNIPSEEIEKPKEMDIDGFENLPKIFITPIEKLMDEFTGSVKEFRGLLKIPETNIPTGNLHQHICNTDKIQFDQTNGDCS